MREEYDYKSYFLHGLQPTDSEAALLDDLNNQLPDQIIDSHVHNSTEESFKPEEMSESSWNSMITTYPVTTIEQSQQIGDIMLPGKQLRRLRFAHAFHGIAHSAVNDYLVKTTPEQDRVALFGLHETSEEIDYTISELERGAGTDYYGLKMYYASGTEPVYDLYQYFPKPILTKAEERDVPIILHLPKTAEKSLEELKDISAKFPKLRIVLAHIGVTWLDSPQLDCVFSELASYKNVFVDTSAVANSAVVVKAITHLGANRILFGSDEPLNLLRRRTFYNPILGRPRIITDYPYHWVDLAEREQFKDTVPDPIYGHLQQLEALTSAISTTAKTEAERQVRAQAIFYDNAKDVYGF